MKYFKYIESLIKKA